MDVTVCIGTYGDPDWITLAQRAAESAEPQAPTVHVHAATLHDARNEALECVNTPFVIFLDADDELEPGYVDAMRAGTADVRAPMLRFIRGRRRQLWRPHVYGHTHECVAECLPEGNWIAVGAMARTDLVRRVGGWRDFPIYEDWELWLRCYLAGGSFEWRPEAIYRAHVRPDSRNRAPSHAAKLEAHRAIYAANFPDQAAA
jgi:glycosyltransferase involved in cell wall biosynthesis